MKRASKAPNWYVETDTWIRLGDFTKALDQIEALRAADSIEAEHYVYGAEIYRRLGHPARAIQLLAPKVYPQGRLKQGVQKALPSEIAEYAGSLIRLGATSEAMRLLKPLQAADAPMKPLFQGLAHIHEWNYAAAVDPLTRASQSLALGEYQRAIAQVNLVQSLTYVDDFAAARRLYEKLIPEFEHKKYTFLHFNVLSLAAMNECLAHQWERSEWFLEKTRAASQALLVEGSYDLLVLEKAQAIAALYTQHDESLIIQTRARAVRFQQPEIARDCDLRLALYHQDISQLAQVYYFTPFQAYRDKIEQLAQQEGLKIPAEWVENEGASSEAWDLLQAPKLKTGHAISRLLHFLLSERYRTMRTTDLVSHIYPESNLNFETSPDQLHQLIKRTRAYLKRSKIPLEIASTHEGFKLQFKKPMSVLHRKLPTYELTLAAKLFVLYGYSDFKAMDAARALGMTQQNVSVLLRREIAAGRVVRTWAGKNTRYCVLTYEKGK